MDNENSTSADVRGPSLTGVNVGTIPNTTSDTTPQQPTDPVSLTPSSMGVASTPPPFPMGGGVAEEKESCRPPTGMARGRRRSRASSGGSDTSGSRSDARPAPVENLAGALSDPTSGRRGSRPPLPPGVLAKTSDKDKKARRRKPANEPLSSSLDRPPLLPIVDTAVELEASFPSFVVLGSALSSIELLSLPGYGRMAIELAIIRGRWFTLRALQRYLLGRSLAVRLRFGAAVETEHKDEADERPYVFRATGQPVGAHIARIAIIWEIFETPGVEFCHDVPPVADAQGAVRWSSLANGGKTYSIDVSINAASMALGRLANMPPTSAARSQIDFLRRSVENNAPWYMADVALNTATYALARHASRFDGGAYYTYRGPLEIDTMSDSSRSSTPSRTE
jgi:hypothetical protein